MCRLVQSSALKNEAVEVKQVAMVLLYHFSYRSYTVDSTKNSLVCAIKLLKVVLTMAKLAVLGPSPCLFIYCV